MNAKPDRNRFFSLSMQFGSALFFVFIAAVLFMGLHFGWLYIMPYIDNDMEWYVKLAFDAVFLLIGSSLTWIYFRNRQKFIEHKNNEERLKLFIRHTPAAVAILDRDMHYLEVSDRWVQDYHIGDENVIGKLHYDVFSFVTYTPEVLAMHQRCLNGETIRRDEIQFVNRDGKIEWVNYEMVPWRAEKGDIGGLIFFAELITERKLTALRLQESEERFHRAMRGSNDGIWDWDVASDTVYYSPQVTQLLGHNRMGENPSIMGWINLIHPEDVAGVSKAWNDHLEKRTPSYQAEFRLPNAAGEYMWLEGRGQAEWDENGRPVRVAGSIVNISEKKRLENLKKEFVYVVTHELRTPLTALKGAIDMLPMLLGKDIPQRVENMLDLAMQGSNRLMLLINDLLEAGRMESGAMPFHPTQVAIDKALEQAVALNKPYGDKYQVSFALQDPGPIRLHIDPDRFQQIMSNLLSNAAKFSPQGGQVDITARTGNNRVCIAVTDHGEGISKSFQPRIFEKFAQGDSSKPGTGLGLNITKTMVEKMDGRIWFESQPGRGTTFFVEFPITQ